MTVSLPRRYVAVDVGLLLVGVTLVVFGCVSPLVGGIAAGLYLHGLLTGLKAGAGR